MPHDDDRNTNISINKNKSKYKKTRKDKVSHSKFRSNKYKEFKSVMKEEEPKPVKRLIKNTVKTEDDTSNDVSE